MMLERLEEILEQHEVLVQRMNYLNSLVRLNMSISDVIHANATMVLISQDIEDIVEAIFK